MMSEVPSLNTEYRLIFFYTVQNNGILDVILEHRRINRNVNVIRDCKSTEINIDVGCVAGM